MEYTKDFFIYLYKIRYKLTYVAIAILIAWAFFYRLNTLTPGPHSIELEYFESIRGLGLKNFLDVLVFLPHAVVSNLVSRILEPSLMSLRLTSVIFAITIVPMIYYVLYIWHTRRIATLGVILLLSSSWFVGLARLGNPDIMYAWGVMAAITAMTMIFHHEKHNKLRLLLLGLAGILIGLSLYVPYIFYIYLLTSILAWGFLRTIIEELKQRELIVLVTGTAIVIAPLIVGLAIEPNTSLILLGLPESIIPTSSTVVLERMSDLFSSIFWRSNESLVTNVGSLPLLGIFGSALAALGIYHYEQHRANLRTHIIVGIFFGMFLVISIDFSAEKSATLLPLVYILIAMGAVTLLTQWYRIFPKNPFARTIGLSVLALFVIITINYHNQRYFSAWAKSPETKISFSDDVILVEKELDKVLKETGGQSVLVFAESNRQNRLVTWLSANNKTVEINKYSPKSALSTPDTIIFGPEMTLQDTAVNPKLYSLEVSIDTTSKLAPQIYKIFSLYTE